VSYKIKRTKNGGVTTPKGFEAGAISCEVKPGSGDRLDLALIHSLHPTVTGAAFTNNQIKAAPVRVSAAHIRGGDIRAIIANSGNANACTGVRGIEDAKSMAQAVAEHYELRRRQILVASTGIIGIPMPMVRILTKVPALCADLSSGGTGSQRAAEAIMTSDTCPKSVSYCIETRGGRKIHIGAIAKGAGMIRPDMATMLCFITTDARIDRSVLQSATLEAVRSSFNRITIDGDTSTNDTVFVMANGAAGNSAIKKGTPLAKAFHEALTRIMDDMARKIVSDGERVTKFVTIEVCGARTRKDARLVAEAIANSTLVKCSWHGSDPNWSRVIHAAGYSGGKVDEEMTDIYFDGIAATRNGMAADTPMSALEKVCAKPKFTVCLDLNMGKGQYTVYTTDYSPGFVEYNAQEYALAIRKRAESGRG